MKFPQKKLFWKYLNKLYENKKWIAYNFRIVYHLTKKLEISSSVFSNIYMTTFCRLLVHFWVLNDYKQFGTCANKKGETLIEQNHYKHTCEFLKKKIKL